VDLSVGARGAGNHEAGSGRPVTTKGHDMRCYNQQHKFYCGVDLHARSMFIQILDANGKTVFEQDLPAEPEAFLKAIKPYRKGPVVGCECMFAWYWLAAVCDDKCIRLTRRMT
jgi:hypothetical protein